MTRGYDAKEGLIIINRELTDLDVFLRDFLEILKKHTDYLVVSGFVSISTGRARGTEDIDILVLKPGREKFERLFNDLVKKGFWCYQGDTAQEAYSYFEKLNSIRFARENGIFPNAELVPIIPAKKAQFFEFNHPQRMKVKNFEFKIPPIEFEILYKELVLKGKKDVEDARHLRTFFSGMLKEEKFKEYKKIIEDEAKD